MKANETDYPPTPELDRMIGTAIGPSATTPACPARAKGIMSTRLRYFWYQEPTEIWAAEDYESFAAEITRMMGSLPDEKPSAENKEDVWDETQPPVTICCDGEDRPFHEYIKTVPRFPWQVCTAYA